MKLNLPAKGTCWWTRTIVSLPMPYPLRFNGTRLPASYANFYVGNRTVAMPAFDDPADEAARAALAACFPGREVVPIDCTDLVLGLGTFHCLTQQVPAFHPEGSS